MKNLYIFASPSSKPDLYVNIINYWVSTYGSKDLGKITLLRLQDQPNNNSDILKELNYTKDCIEKQMYYLVGGMYLSWSPLENGFSNIEEPQKIEISSEFKDVYKETFAFISQNSIFVDVLNKENIGDQINTLFSEEYEENFDVTGVINRHLVLISTYLLARNYSLYSLEIHKRFSHNHHDLIHNLNIDDYTYHYLEIPDEIRIKFELKSNMGATKALFSEKVAELRDSKHKWLNLLAKDRTEIAIQEILNFSFDSGNTTMIIESVHQSSRWERLSRLISNSLISDDDGMREQRKIVYSIIELIQRMEGLLKEME